MMNDKSKITVAIKCEIICGLSIGILAYNLNPFKMSRLRSYKLQHLTLTYLNVKVMHISTMNILNMVTVMVRITIAIK